MFHYASLLLPILIADAESENFLDLLELLRIGWNFLESAGRVVYGTVKPAQVFCV